jgi:hypothetical protein
MSRSKDPVKTRLYYGIQLGNLNTGPGCIQAERKRWRKHVLQCGGFIHAAACHTAPVHLAVGILSWITSQLPPFLSHLVPAAPWNQGRTSYLDASHRCQIAPITHIFTQIKPFDSHQGPFNGPVDWLAGGNYFGGPLRALL